MKRIRSACLVQTLHFQLKDGVPQDQAVEAVQEEYRQYKARMDRNHTRYRIVKEEYRQYKARMDRNHTRYRIVKEETQSDGSIVIEIKKQYNTTSCGTYLD